jgi:hypothetical protein
VNRREHPPRCPRRSGVIRADIGQTESQVSEDTKRQDNRASQETDGESLQWIACFLSSRRA